MIGYAPITYLLLPVMMLETFTERIDLTMWRNAA